MCIHKEKIKHEFIIKINVINRVLFNYFLNFFKFICINSICICVNYYFIVCEDKPNLTKRIKIDHL